MQRPGSSVGSWATVSPGGLTMREYGQQARHVALPPFHDLVQAGAAVDRNGDAPRQHDEQPFGRAALRGQHVAGVQLSKRAVRGEPRQLLARRRAERPVRRQPIDEVGRRHEPVTP